MQNKVFCLMGPTASGKTSLAIELARRFPVEIISVDSAMIYRFMDIGTAKPTAAELALAPHHLIDILNPVDSFSAADFCLQANQLCQAIIARGNIPLLVGGTMMYFHALQQGLSVLPAADDALRADLVAKAKSVGQQAMHDELASIDALAAKRIHAHDTQRVQRALEVYYLTGKPLSCFLAEQKISSPWQFTNLILFPDDRVWLHQRIATRFEQMLQQGFLAEVESLLQTWPLLSGSLAMRSVGYRQACDYLAGMDDYQTFVNKGIAATRQLAKRQLTWLRRWPKSLMFTAESATAHQEIMVIMAKILDN